MNDLFTSIADRPLPLQMRRDLIVRRQTWQGREYWTIKDPLTLKYYRFEDEEFAILSLLDGQTSSRAIRDEFERRFAPQRITSSQVQHLFTMLHRSNLLVANAAGQGELLTRDNQPPPAMKLAVISYRFRGFDPDRLAESIRRLDLSPAAAVRSDSADSHAGGSDSIWLRLPTFRGFCRAELVLAGVLHELGTACADWRRIRDGVAAQRHRVCIAT
jgi:putative peptide zinc metalloprotease protein